MVLAFSLAGSRQPVSMQAKGELDALADSDAATTDSDVRYFAYASRLRTAIRTAHRYIAYTSDVGEAFRPVVHPYVVTGAYAVSWAYLVGDVAFETWKSHRRGPTPLEASTFSEETRLTLVALKRGAFQAIASMALPALTIHTVVRQSSRLLARTNPTPTTTTTSGGASSSERSLKKNGWFRNMLTIRNVKVRAWAPTVLGLAVVPALPYLFDKPVESATDAVFEWAEMSWYKRVAERKRREKEEKGELGDR